MAKAEKSIHANHRQRVFEEIEACGIEHLSEYRVLEYILFFCIPRGDTNPIAHALIEEFGDLAGVLEASELQLRNVKGVGPVTARFLHALPLIDHYYFMNKAKRNLKLDTTETRVKYLVPLFRMLSVERFYVLALDKRKKLLKTILLTEGGNSSVNIAIKQLIDELSRIRVDSVLIAHNHPNEVLNPSRNDVEATAAIIRALGLLKIRVVDHIIVVNEEYYSMAEHEMLPFYNMDTGELRCY